MEQQNPWITIWRHPRMTIRSVVSSNPDRFLWWLAAIYGFCSMLNLMQSMNIGNLMGIAGILIFSLILAPIYGFVSFSIWSWFVYQTGKWFKGQGTFKSVRASYAWSCAPILINIPLWLLMVTLFGHQLFMNFPDAAPKSNSQIIFLFAILIIKVAVAVWSLLIFLNGLAEVQKYSMTKAVFNLIIAGLILGVLFSVLWSVLLYALGGVAASPFVFLKTI